jgi:hypothetical protein
MTDTKHASIAAALAKAQSEMGKALKDAANPHFKSKYADLSSVTGACMPALNANGIAVIQPFFDDETGRYVKTILIHGASGETLECRVPLIVAKNDMQGFGSAATYARRYGLMAMTGIAPEDDDGNAAAKSPPKDETRQPSVDPREVEQAKAIMLSAPSLDALKAAFLALPKPIQQAVTDQKDTRKFELESLPADDLAGDHIPYEGK